MGTRIHKVLGYGAKHPNYRQMNDRLYENNQPNEVDKLMKFVRNNLSENDKDRFELAFQCNRVGNIVVDNYPNFLYELVHFGEHPDCQPDGYTIIIPPNNLKTWYRSDNDIDYQEADREDLDTKVRLIKTPLYPYLNWMHKDIGEPIKDFDFIQNKLEDDPNLVPWVPKAVQIIATEIGFPDWKVLRPMIS